MGQMMDPAAMQGHMKNVLSDDAYQRMLDAMGGQAGRDAHGDVGHGRNDGGYGGLPGPGWSDAARRPGAGQHEGHHSPPTSG